MAKAAARVGKPVLKKKTSPVRQKKPARASAAAKRKPPAPAPRKSAPAKAQRGKWVYTFGDGSAEGKASMRDLLGGKGANLAEMANLGLPVPPGFTITTEVCTYFYGHDQTYPASASAIPPTRCWCRCAPARAPRCPA
jgi:pyruvate,orthophosphate dikinase